MEHVEDTFQAPDKAQMYYQYWRSDEPKATLVIIHGLGEHSGRYQNVVNQLVPNGYAIYGMDNRGHGRSPGKKGHIENWSIVREDLHAFVRLVQEKEKGRPFFLLGHSLGGCIMLDYALHYPEDLTTVVASSPAINKEDVPAFLAAASKIMAKIKPDLSVSTGLDATAISRDTAVVEAYLNDPLVHDRGTPGATVAYMKTAEWVTNHAADFKPPILLTHGDADRIVNIQGTLNFYDQVRQPDKKLIIYEGGFHEPHNDLDYEAVVANIQAWLEAHL